MTLITDRGEKSRAARIRRSLATDGYRLAKCRRGYGGYGVLDRDIRCIVLGLSADTRGYDASLDDVESWMTTG